MRGKQLGFEGREQRLAIKRMGVALNMSMVITMMMVMMAMLAMMMKSEAHSLLQFGDILKLLGQK